MLFPKKEFHIVTEKYGLSISIFLHQKAFNVSSIPMLALIKDGKMIDQSIGYCPKEDILAMLKKL